MSYQSSQTYINLPVKDINRTKEFFGSIGFEFNAQFSDENSACLVVNDNTFVQMLTESYFNTYVSKPIADLAAHSAGIIALSANSRKHADELAEKAYAAGGKPYKDTQDHGFMYVRNFEDPNGHLWEICYFDMSAFNQ
ncbi:MAG: glyoxalase/bleomycin resistance/extradiol dioxygenase family protein [Cohnella sp.]|nr:glyoxalase/bleomycin resistance/extradiol dioxygenase family protein [Cohnella sp.]